MKAIAKVRPEPGVELIDAPEPQVQPGTVKVKLEAASVCGTDLHIYSWDAWAASRIKPPRIIGHEFCGTITEVGPGVTDRRVGDFVASESHIVCGRCVQCLQGQGHVCANTRILGVDVDGGFAPFVVIPKDNAVPTDRKIPAKIACFQDALGNAVHTALAGPVEGCNILITGLGPIGLMAAEVCRVLGASKIVGTEVSPYRIDLATKLRLDKVLNPKTDDLDSELGKLAPGGFDAVLEMSGHPSSLELAVKHVRPGGRISLLGVFGENGQCVRVNDLVFKGIDVQGIVGRRLWKTWEQMQALLLGGCEELRAKSDENPERASPFALSPSPVVARQVLDVSPVVTHELPYTAFSEAMELMKKGEAGKVVFLFD